MLAAYGLGNVLGCDVNDLVCLEVACGAGMNVNQDASTRGVAPCVPQCPSGQTLNTSTLTCEAPAADAQTAALLTPIDATSSSGSAADAFASSILNPANWGSSSTGSSTWKWILGGIAVVGIGLLAWHHHAHAAPAAA